MKRILGAMLFVLLLSGGAMASVISVDFSVLALPININGSPTSLNGVSFQYVPGGDPLLPPANCGFDAGLGGTQFTFACVGAQLDTSGLTGTTDGAYMLNFGGETNGLNFLFGIFSFMNPTPANTDFGVTALFFNRSALTDIVIMDGTSMACDGFGNCSGGFGYSGPTFTQAVLNFSPFSNPPAAGESLLQANTLTYNSVPEPGTLLYLACAAVALGLGRLAKRWA